MNPPSKNITSVMCGQRRSRSDCADAQSGQGLRCPQTESFDTIDCFNGEQVPSVQDDVNPHILHMFEGTFSLDASRVYMY